MSGRIILPGSADPARSEFAKDINRIVKKFRGTSRPFITLLVEAGGEVTVLSNMDKHAEKVDLLTQVANKLRQVS